jgi:hypothetical protein
MPCAPSLRPGLKLMLDLVNGSSVARAICDSWNPKLFFSTLIVVEYD